ncbi:MAG: hypothetical protein ACKV19_01475 [Verrucomicrobiales bacterium]
MRIENPTQDVAARRRLVGLPLDHHSRHLAKVFLHLWAANGRAHLRHAAAVARLSLLEVRYGWSLRERVRKGGKSLHYTAIL